jgi:hypothetical protein
MLAATVFQFIRFLGLIHPAVIYTRAAWLTLGAAGIANWLLVEIQRRYSPPDFQG